MKTIITVITLAASAILADVHEYRSNAGRRNTRSSDRRRSPCDRRSSHSLIMIIRHGEKPDGSNPGVDPPGTGTRTR